MYWIQSIDNGPRRVNHAAGALNQWIYSFGGYSNAEDYTRVTPIDIHMLDTRRENQVPDVLFCSVHGYI